MNSWTIKKTLDWTTEYFKKFNIEWPHLEAEILLAHTLNLKRIDLYTKFEQILSPEELSRFKSLIQRRSKHEPIAYITNNQPFMSLDFYVDQSVLIPRPETEQLVEVAIDAVKMSKVQGPMSLIADIGTGCGAIAISLAKFIPETKVTGIDSSSDAIKIAQRNAQQHGVDDRCQFMQGNLFEALHEKVDMIISNPPYIPSHDIEKLENDVKLWEPKEALDGGKDGLDYISKIIEQAPKHLNLKGLLLVEIGFDQGEKVLELSNTNGKYSESKIIKDLNGKDRILKAKL